MSGPARALYIYEEIDTETLPVPERFALWRETGRLPMTAEPPDAESRRRFHICLRRLSGASGRFADLTATPMKLSREKSHYARDALDMVSFTLMLGPQVRHQFRDGGSSVVVQPGQILIKDFAQPATAWWQTSSRSLNLQPSAGSLPKRRSATRSSACTALCCLRRAYRQCSRFNC